MFLKLKCSGSAYKMANLRVLIGISSNFEFFEAKMLQKSHSLGRFHSQTEEDASSK